MSNLLKTYGKKRNFSKTPEPSGKKTKKISKQLRFVVQKHEASHLHYDFRLEMQGVLKSWAIPKGPSLDPHIRHLAVMVEDHPLDYRTFEGIIPEGNYGAGTVMVWDEGIYEPRKTTQNPERELLQELKNGHITVILHGEKLHGEFALLQLKGKGDNAWLLVKKEDSYASRKDVTKKNRSVSTGRDLEEISHYKQHHVWVSNSKNKEKHQSDPFPESISPMLATLVDRPFDKRNWLFEKKWDGYRCLAYLKKGEVKLFSRNHISFNEKYPTLVNSLQKLPIDAVLDGEIIVKDKKGKYLFQNIQNFSEQGGTVEYILFDILYLNGYDLQSLPLSERKKLLDNDLFKKLRHIRISAFQEEQGNAFFRDAIKKGFEGIIAKDMQSSYEAGKRSNSWLKIKSTRRQEAIICGFTDPRGTRSSFGALVLGQYKRGKLLYVGHSGSGFTQKSLALMMKKLTPLIRKTSPFTHPPVTNAPVTWVEPKLLCEIDFTEWTDAKVMRHPVFAGLREDKSPRSVQEEKPVKTTMVLTKEQTTTAITHPDKILFPDDGFTKQDIVNYYREIAPVMLPYLKDRPQSLNRHPNGISQGGFFQKDITFAIPSFAKTISVKDDTEHKTIKYLVCNNEKTLLYMANLDCIEINPWISHSPYLNKPDFLVLDLDPEAIDFSYVITTALQIKNILDTAGVPGYPKTSGKRGLHILIPLGAKYSFDQARQFGEILARIVHNSLPDITSIERSPRKRQGKVYIDYLQNRLAQTIASPYSVRPVKGASVSAPLEWAELTKNLDPKKFTIKTMKKRLEEKGDLLQGLLTKSIDLGKVLKRLAAQQ